MLDRRLVALMAVAGGASVANLYYMQPLLPAVAGALRVSDATAGALVTASQVGYAVGLVFVAPLGDVTDRRRLSVRLLALSGCGLALTAAAPTFAVLAVALALAAVASSVAQVLLPFAGLLAGEEERGRVVGTVMSGLLSGVLLGRFVAGLVASVTGWRGPFALAAVLAFVLAGAVWRWLPSRPPSSDAAYGALLRSLGRLLLVDRELRRRMAYGACGFAGFSAAWTAVAFLLAGDPYNYGERTISLFALAGLAGALAAQRLGGRIDRGLARSTTGALLMCVLAGWALLVVKPTAAPVLILGLIVLDFAVQGQNVTSQALLARDPATSGRKATMYVTSNFAGGAVGSLASAVAWTRYGWDGVCAVGAVFGVIALLVWSLEPT